MRRVATVACHEQHAAQNDPSAPGSFNSVDWPRGGQLVVSTRPHVAAWPADGVSPRRKLVREIVRSFG